MSAIRPRSGAAPTNCRAWRKSLRLRPAVLAARMGVTEADIRAIEAESRRDYDAGGFKVYDVSDPTKPKEIAHQRTGGIGVHRFDMDDRYAYISTEMKGYIGNILVIYD